MRPAWAEVDLSAVRHNVATLRAEIGDARFCAVVKAEGYGHGAVAVGRAALEGGADLLAVALVAEGAQLRSAGLDSMILVLSQASPGELDELVANHLDATVYTSAGVEALSRSVVAAHAGPYPVHLKVDTGMHRIGVAPVDAVDLAAQIAADANLRLASVFTHCAVADEPDNDFTAHQLATFGEVVEQIRAAGIVVPMCHAANTAAALDHPEARLDLVRVGIGLYGLDPSPELAGRVPLRPALSLKARVSHVKRVAAGEGISYGLRYRPAQETTIATVPLGYADGVSRRLGAVGAEVLIGGRRHRIAGTVTMDQLLVDCGQLPVAVGDEVVLLGHQGGGAVTAQEWADLLDSIPYEMVCGISPRVPRRYVEAPPP